jgi:hypothetical protein
MQTITRLDENLVILAALTTLMSSDAIEAAIAVGARLRIGQTPTRFFWRGRLLPSQAIAILFLLDIRETEVHLSYEFLVMESLRPISSVQQKTLASILRDFSAITVEQENEESRRVLFDGAASWYVT